METWSLEECAGPVAARPLEGAEAGDPTPDDQTLAVAVGHCFALCPRSMAKGIRLRPTSETVEVRGELYPLLKGRTFEDSQRVDRLLDEIGEMRIREHLVGA